MKNILTFLLNIDEYLINITNIHRYLTYGLLSFVIFLETGLVITPFLPGDSLLFTAGALAAIGPLKLIRLIPLLFLSAVTGDSVNYFLGNKVGVDVFDRYPKLFKKKHLKKTQQFYDKHGGKTVIIARFIPIVRTFAPFVAGVGSMEYKRFLVFSLIGGFAWTSTFILTGYFFGNIPFVKEYFELFILLIIFISFLPIISKIFKRRKGKKR